MFVKVIKSMSYFIVYLLYSDVHGSLGWLSVCVIKVSLIFTEYFLTCYS